MVESKHVIAGIDYSMSCPAICLYFTNTKKYKIFFFTDTKKYIQQYCNNTISGVYFSKEDHDSDESRFNSLSDKVIDLLYEYACMNVAIEGYSMGSKGRVFGIAENTGLLKHKLWKNNIRYEIYAPKAIKKFATGSGNANKNLMYDYFLNETRLDLRSELQYNAKDVGSPIADIVDSFYICKYFFNNFEV